MPHQHLIIHAGNGSWLPSVRIQHKTPQFGYVYVLYEWSPPFLSQYAQLSGIAPDFDRK